VVLEKPSSLLTEHDGLIHFEERPLDHRFRQSVPLQYPIIEPHQHFELCERCLVHLGQVLAPLRNGKHVPTYPIGTLPRKGPPQSGGPFSFASGGRSQVTSEGPLFRGR